jgi:hypothetical protein
MVNSAPLVSVLTASALLLGGASAALNPIVIKVARARPHLPAMHLLTSSRAPNSFSATMGPNSSLRV